MRRDDSFVPFADPGPTNDADSLIFPIFLALMCLITSMRRTSNASCQPYDPSRHSGYTIFLYGNNTSTVSPFSPNWTALRSGTPHIYPPQSCKVWSSFRWNCEGGCRSVNFVWLRLGCIPSPVPPHGLARDSTRPPVLLTSGIETLEALQLDARSGSVGARNDRSPN